MKVDFFIIVVKVREIFDLRGNLIVEVEVVVNDEFVGRVVVLLGVLIGIFEVVEFRDGDKKRYMGKGVFKVVENVNEVIVLEIIGMNVFN